MSGARIAGKDATAGDASKAKGLGLTSVSSLSGLMKKHEPNKPMELVLDLIDEDPTQPRSEGNPGFSKESLEELAAGIARRGVKSPISVRANPEQTGRFIINHGARRYRASRLAGKKTIPAFVDEDYGTTDQLLENIDREALTAREIGDYVGREIAQGKTQREIAAELSKSQSWVAQYATLLRLPDSIQEAFTAGRTSDVTLINELVKAHKKDSEEVDRWLGVASQEISRQSVQMLRGFIDGKIAQDRAPATSARVKSTDSGRTSTEGASASANGGSLPLSGSTSGETSNAANVTSSEPQPAPSPSNPPREQQPNSASTSSARASAAATASEDPAKLKRAIVQVQFNERPARLVLDRRAPAPGWAWLKFDEDGQEVEAELGAVRLVAVVEG
jgi:ParB family chromosome partitioning protein